MFPKYEEIQIPLLSEIANRGGKSRPADKNSKGQTIYEAIADYFGLSADTLNIEIYEANDKPRSKWENMVRWTRNDLVKQGYLISTTRGVWQITTSGMNKLRTTSSRR